MAIDASIPLQAKAPVFEQPDIATPMVNAAKIKAAQLDSAAKQNDEEYKLLSAATPENYEQVKQIAAQKYGPDALKMIPPAYDKAALDNLAASRLDIKDKLTMAQQKLEYQLSQDKFSEEKRHNVADEAINNKKADSPFGNSLQGKAYGTLLSGDPASQQYALATSIATQPKLQPIHNADGTTQLVAVTPQLPGSIRPPAGAPNPTANPNNPVLTPPVVRGSTDATPTTQGPLLAPPPGSAPQHNYTVTPIAGTQGGQQKGPNEQQANAALYSQRMEEANNIIGSLGTAGYKPNMATESLGDSRAGNYLLSGQGQQFTQAERNFLTATLRRESGAAISPSEFDQARLLYFPQPGDKPEQLAQKAAARQTAISGIKNAAGQYAIKDGSTGSSPTVPISHDAIDAELARRKAK